MKPAPDRLDNTSNKYSPVPSRPVPMTLFGKTKKKLEEEREARQQLENEVAERKRQERLAQKAHQREIEQSKQLLENKLAERKRQERLAQEAHQREIEQSKQLLENELAERKRQERLAQEAHQREIEQSKQQLLSARNAQQELQRQVNRRQNLEYAQKRVEEEQQEREEEQRRIQQRKIQEASPETLRSLRELIRLKYQLDLEIWGLRGARKADRPLVEEKMEKADAVLEEIMAMIRVWENQTDGSWDAAEWDRVQEIRRRLQKGGIRVWAEDPLWSEARDGNVDKRKPTSYKAYRPSQKRRAH